MKQLLVAISIAFTLSGCFTTIEKQVQIVTVDKPIPFIPPPPIVPTFESQVDKLQDDDYLRPGKVAQAYKYDMTALRGLVSIYAGILDQYRASALDFDEVNRQIDALFDNLNTELKK